MTDMKETGARGKLVRYINLMDSGLNFCRWGLDAAEKMLDEGDVDGALRIALGRIEVLSTKCMIVQDFIRQLMAEGEGRTKGGDHDKG